MDVFAICFCTLFWGVLWLMVASAYTRLYKDWKSLGVGRMEERTEPSEDYMEERQRVLEMIMERLTAMGDSRITCMNGESKPFVHLEDSSEVASLFRFAHFGGCHLTFEQDADGEDLEEGCPDVFKTDLKKAAEHREGKKWERYRRY